MAKFYKFYTIILFILLSNAFCCWNSLTASYKDDPVRDRAGLKDQGYYNIVVNKGNVTFQENGISPKKTVSGIVENLPRLTAKNKKYFDSAKEIEHLRQKLGIAQEEDLLKTIEEKFAEAAKQITVSNQKADEAESTNISLQSDNTFLRSTIQRLEHNLLQANTITQALQTQGFGEPEKIITNISQLQTTSRQNQQIILNFCTVFGLAADADDSIVAHIGEFHTTAVKNQNLLESLFALRKLTSGQDILTNITELQNASTRHLQLLQELKSLLGLNQEDNIVDHVRKLQTAAETNQLILKNIQAFFNLERSDEIVAYIKGLQTSAIKNQNLLESLFALRKLTSGQDILANITELQNASTRYLQLLQELKSMLGLNQEDNIVDHVRKLQTTAETNQLNLTNIQTFCNLVPSDDIVAYIKGLQTSADNGTALLRAIRNELDLSDDKELLPAIQDFHKMLQQLIQEKEKVSSYLSLSETSAPQEIAEKIEKLVEAQNTNTQEIFTLRHELATITDQRTALEQENTRLIKEIEQIREAPTANQTSSSHTTVNNNIVIVNTNFPKSDQTHTSEDEQPPSKQWYISRDFIMGAGFMGAAMVTLGIVWKIKESMLHMAFSGNIIAKPN